MKNFNVLLVEDNEEDAFLIKEAFNVLEFIDHIYHVDNGKKAISFLKKESPYEKVKEPSLILMDINMPIMDGHETLTKIKTFEEFKHIPVIMLTTSSRNEDILLAYKEQSNSYIVKPDDIYELDDIAGIMKAYWSRIVKLPNR